MNSRNHLSVVSIHGVSAVCICIRLEVLSLLSATSFPYLFLIVMEMLTPHPGRLSWSFACGGQMTSTPKLCLSGTFGDNWSLKSRCAWENLTNLSRASELPGHTVYTSTFWCVVCVVCDCNFERLLLRVKVLATSVKLSGRICRHHHIK